MLFNNFITERAKLSKGSDAKPRVKSSMGMIAGLPKVPANAFIQLDTKAFFVFGSSLETFATPLFFPISASPTIGIYQQA